MKKFMALFFFSIVIGVSAVSAQSAQPTFAALDMQGQKVDTAALRGKVVVLNLWFVNCPNCVEEIKMLNTLVDQYKGNDNVVFLGLAASSKPVLEKFLVKNPFSYRVVPGAQMIIISKFGEPKGNGELTVPFPMHYVLDREGKVVFKGQGIKSIDGMKKELASQLAKK